MSTFTLYSRTPLLYRLLGRDENLESTFDESHLETEAVDELKNEARDKLGVAIKGSGWGVSIKGSYDREKHRRFEEMKARKRKEHQASKKTYFENRAQKCGFCVFSAEQQKLAKLPKHRGDNWLSIVINGELVSNNVLVGNFEFGLVAGGSLRLGAHNRESLSDKWHESGHVYKRWALKHKTQDDELAASKCEQFSSLFDSDTPLATILKEVQKDSYNHARWYKQHNTLADKYVADVCLEVEQDIGRVL